MIRLNKLPEVGESWCPIVDTAARAMGRHHLSRTDGGAFPRGAT
jgi:hypothetical protein